MFLNWKAVLDLAAGIASIVGLGISIIGAWFSLRAWQRAKAAEAAAREAREAVRKGNAGEELRELSERGKELLGFAQNEQFDAALLRSRDLLAGIAQARHRWESFLSQESSAQIQKAGKEVGRISRALSAGREPIPPEGEAETARILP